MGRLRLSKFWTVFAIVAVFSLDVVAGIKHPSLLFTPDRVSAAKKTVKNDTAMQKAWEYIQGVAEKEVSGKRNIM